MVPRGAVHALAPPVRAPAYWLMPNLSGRDDDDDDDGDGGGGNDDNDSRV